MLQVYSEPRLTYTIDFEFNDKIDSGKAPRPKVLPELGQVIKFKQACTTLASVSYNPGDSLILIGRTPATPHNRQSSLGNWLVKCKHFVSVWTNIEWGMADGLLVLGEEKLSKENRLMTLRYEGRFEIYQNEYLGIRIARHRQGGMWALSDINNLSDFDQDIHRHDLAERYGLTLDIRI